MRSVAKFILGLLLIAIILICVIFFVPAEPFKSLKKEIVSLFTDDEAEEAEEEDEGLKEIKEYLVGNWGMYSYTYKKYNGTPETWYVGDYCGAKLMKTNTFELEIRESGGITCVTRLLGDAYVSGDWHITRDKDTGEISLNVQRVGAGTLIFNEDDKTIIETYRNYALFADENSYETITVYKKLS